MGFVPSQIDQMSAWEWASVVDGYIKAHGGKSGPVEVEDETLRRLGIEGF